MVVHLHENDPITEEKPINLDIKGIVFDIDDTLYRRDQPYEMALDQFFPSGIPFTSVQFSERFRARGDEVFEPSERGEITMDEMYIYRGTKAFADLGVTVSAREALRFQKIYSAAQRQIRPTAKVVRMLKKLCTREDVRIGILSNGGSEHQRRKLSDLGLTNFFKRECVVISGDCGIMKPDHRIFDKAAQIMGLQPSELLYVGDNYDLDVVGAKAAGWKTLWYNRRRIKAPWKQKGRTQDAEKLPIPDGVVFTEEEMCHDLTD
ncbi:MAG: HAD family hydrolase [Lachnospiraceae bacterium]|nr:HAD family hydrolase [Lachnospiraceae bacterium]